MINSSPINGAAINSESSGVEGILTGATLLSIAAGVAYTDYTDGLTGNEIERYVMDLDSVRVPISSWQATLKTDVSNYVQCVIPAVGQWVSTIDGATNFTIYKQITISGLVVEQEMASAPVSTIQYSQGASKYTCVLSGYSDGFAPSIDPPSAYDRTLEGVRTVSSGAGGIRVRCKIDLLLRPGHRAYVDGVPFIVGYINYYALDSDSYMDVGE